MKPEDILRSAFRVWGKDAYKKTSLSDIARDLGVTKPALYRHFPNKNALMDTMFADYFDRYGAYLRERILASRGLTDKAARFFAIVDGIVEYNALHKDDFVFSFAQVLGNRHPCRNFSEELEKRGVSFEELHDLGKGAGLFSHNALAGVTSFFFVALFHLNRCDCPEAPTQMEIEPLVTQVRRLVGQGLGFDGAEVDNLAYADLDRAAAVEPVPIDESGKLLRSVATAVAAVGPWHASMELVAQHSGLSKSGLYAHFASKQEMLKQLLLTEVDQIAKLLSARGLPARPPAERLYLFIATVAAYLRSRPDILTALDWIRIQRLDLGVLVPERIFTIFDFLPPREGDQPALSAFNVARWVLFMVVNLLMTERMSPGDNLTDEEKIKKLFRYVALGTQGYTL